MGSTLYSETLIGMTIQRAYRFIKENNVYFDINNSIQKIECIRIVEEFMTKDLIPSRLNVVVENYIIIKIVSMG